MKAGTILKIATPGYIEAHPAHLREGMLVTLGKVQAAAEIFNRDCDIIDTDANLSAKGRVAGKARVAVAALAKLSEVEATTIGNLTNRAASIERALLGVAAIAAPSDPAERLSYEMRLQEIRSELRELPSGERLTVYLTTSDPLVIAALETAPMTLSARRPNGSRGLESFIDPEQRTAAVLARAERADPAAVNTLRELQSLREVYCHAVSSVRTEILREVPDAVGDATPAVHVAYGSVAAT